jgi:hypothetical protein
VVANHKVIKIFYCTTTPFVQDLGALVTHAVTLTSLLVMVPLGAGRVAAQDGNSWKAKLLREAPTAWEKYHTRAKGLQGSWTVSRWDVQSRTVISKDYYELKQRQGHVLVLDQGEGSGNLRAVNPQYDFSLKRQKDNAKWVVTGIRGTYKPGFIDDPAYTAGLVNRLPFTFGGVVNTLQVTVMDPGFSIKAVVPEDVAGQSLVKVVFEYVPPKDAARMPLRSGVAYFDPGWMWTLTKVEAQTLWGDAQGLETVDYEYAEADAGFRLLKKVVNRRRIPSKAVDVEFRHDFSLREEDVPASAFRLSAFGFPEPQGVTWDEGPRWYLWFASVGAVCLIAAAYWAYRARSRRQSTPIRAPDY